MMYNVHIGRNLIHVVMQEPGGQRGHCPPPQYLAAQLTLFQLIPGPPQIFCTFRHHCHELIKLRAHVVHQNAFLPQFFENSLATTFFDSVHIIGYHGNTVCGVFKRGIQNLKGFWLKIKCYHWILWIGVTGRCQKVQKFDSQSQFFTSKIIRIFLIFIFIEE